MADVKSDRRQALDLAIASIDRQFGKGAIMRLGQGGVFDERRWRREAGPPLRSALAQLATTAFGTLRIAEVALMRSDLSPAGARYTTRRAVSLAHGVSNASH